MSKLVGLEVYNKRNGIIGVVVSENADVVVIDNQGVTKTVTHPMFELWYTFVPQEEAVVEPKTPPIEETEDSVSGIGVQLRDRFTGILKDIAKDDTNSVLDITLNPSYNQQIVKFNGHNVFECVWAKRRFSVLCHPDSLTPDNLKRVTKIFPREWGWSLRAKFVFTELPQWVLMKTIIVDGLFYRRKED